MEHLTYASGGKDQALYFKALNTFTEPMGITFKPNNGIKSVYLFDHSCNCIGTINYNNFVDNTTNEIQINEFRKLLIHFDVVSYTTVIILEDKLLGRTEINFKHNTGCFQGSSKGVLDLYPPYIQIEDASIAMYDETNGGPYLIKYNRKADQITFCRSDINGSISMSRGDSTDTKLVFHYEDDNRDKTISSEGDETQHRMSFIASLKETPFEVIYTEKNKHNGYQNTIDKSRDLRFKHFNNTKLVNNANVRDFLDDIIDEYGRRFSCVSTQEGVLGGYLYKEYVYGEPNTRTIANNFLEEVGLPVKSRGSQRNRNKGEKAIK